MAPQLESQFFQQRQPTPPVGEIKPERNHKSRSQQFACDRTDPELRQSGPQAAGQQAHQQVTANPPRIVAELVNEQGFGFAADVIGKPHVQGCNDTTAHAKTMAGTQQANNNGGAKSEIDRHRLLRDVVR